jgi:hypothetical protein
VARCAAFQRPRRWRAPGAGAVARFIELVSRVDEMALDAGRARRDDAAMVMPSAIGRR